MPNKITSEAAPPAGGNGFSIISKTKLLALYQALLRCRAFEDRMAGLRKLQSSRPNRNRGRSLRPSPHAAAVAAIIDLASGDTVVSSKADFIPRFLRGASANALLAGLRNGPDSGGASPGALLERALTAGRARKRPAQREIVEGNIAVVFGADESASPAAWRETLRMAAAERLPILFIDSHRPARGDAMNGAKKREVPAIAVDANDVVALYRVILESIAHARRGNGPTLIECAPWPASLARHGPAAPHDAIQNMERYLAQAVIPFPRSRRKTAEELARERRIAAEHSD